MYQIYENFEIKKFTSFKIGGKVRYYVDIHSLDDLEELMFKVKKSKLPFKMLGGGSNILCTSSLYNGWIIKLSAQNIDQKGILVDVEAGLNLAKLIKFTIKEKLSGLQKLSGIPGTVGGAISGNAGAFEVSIADYLDEVLIFDAQALKYDSLKKNQCLFNYRQSIFKKNKHLIIAGARFLLKVETMKKIKQEMQEILQKRKKSSLYKHPCAGSIFKNIALKDLQLKNHFYRDLIETYAKDLKIKDKDKIQFISAGYLIEAVGLLGKKIGQAMIAKDHGNLIYNLGEATFADVMQLITLAKKRVKDEFGILLQPEIDFIA